MKNKILNIVGILAVIITAFFAAHICKGNKMAYEQLGKFNLNALENAPERVKESVEKTREGVKKIVANPNKTYMNFVRALEDNSYELHEITYPIYHLNGVMHSEETEKIMNDILPVMSDFSSDMARHKGIYQGFLEIKKNEYEKLNDEQKKVIDDSIRNFKIAGIDLPSEEQTQLKQISAELSKLSQEFSNNVIAANKSFSIKITDEKLLGNMPQSDKDANKITDGWEFSLLAPSYIPFMTYVSDRELRSKMYRAYITRAPENEKLIPKILSLHQETARILGYKNYAELAFEDRAAPSPKEAGEFLHRIADAARPQALKELEELKERAAKDGVKDFSQWDKAYYSEKILKEKYSLDENETKPYFEADATTKRVFDLLQEMFDIKLVERKVSLWHPTAHYFDVMKEGKIIGGFYVDLQTRKEKQSGAWENGFHSHHINSNNELCLPEAVIVGNFPPAINDAPALLSLNNVSTLFHETGHALMDLLSKVNESPLSGNAVDWDVVEFPSQFLEYFWDSPKVLKRIAKHYKTGAEMPDELIQKINKAQHFQKGMWVLRQIEFGIFDLEIYQSQNLSETDVQKALDETRKKIAIMPAAPYDKYQNGFLHIFSGPYSAGYYSYMWAELLAADAFIAMNKDPFSPLMKKYQNIILANGDTKKMDVLYREFIGRDPLPDSLLKAYGLK